MTNTEAIEYIKKTCYGEWCEDDWREAMDMAIKALEAQEWVPVDKKPHPDTPEMVQVQLDNGWIITAYYQENEWLSVPDCGEPIEDRWIKAWRNLPEPYREYGNEQT